jgi:hypothetical protein
MEIKVGKYVLRSDRFCMWIGEEYEVQKGKTKGKTVTKRVAGYSDSFDTLLRRFVKTKHRDNDAKTVKELLEVFKKTAEDTEAIKKTAIKEDFKLIRQKSKELGR